MCVVAVVGGGDGGGGGGVFAVFYCRAIYLFLTLCVSCLEQVLLFTIC